MRQRRRHLAKRSELARLDQIGLGLTQLLFGRAALGDFALKLPVDLGQVGGALLDPPFQLLMRRLLQLHSFGEPRPALQNNGCGKACEAEQQHAAAIVVHACACAERVSVSTFTSSPASGMSSARTRYSRSVPSPAGTVIRRCRHLSSSVGPAVRSASALA